MKVSTKQILTVLYILSWIIFVGICIEASAFISSALATLLLTPNGARHFWHQVDLSGLYKYDTGYYCVETFLISMVAVMKAIMFYLIINMLHGGKLNMSRPFNKAMERFIIKIAYLAFLIGMFSAWGVSYAGWFVKQGVNMPGVESLGIGGADVWLFMSVVLFVIAQIFKRGIEIQTENELTV